MALKTVEVLKDFPYSLDGINAVDFKAKEIREINEGNFAGLADAGYVKGAKVTVDQPVESEPEPVAEPVEDKLETPAYKPHRGKHK